MSNIVFDRWPVKNSFVSYIYTQGIQSSVSNCGMIYETFVYKSLYQLGRLWTVNVAVNILMCQYSVQYQKGNKFFLKHAGLCIKNGVYVFEQPWV